MHIETDDDNHFSAPPATQCQHVRSVSVTRLSEPPGTVGPILLTGVREVLRLLIVPTWHDGVMDAANEVYMQDEQVAFGFVPGPSHSDLFRIARFAETLGYAMTIRKRGYTLEKVQHQLREDGPSAFLRLTQLQEDVSPKASAPQAMQYVAERLGRLAPQVELIITDPYLFTRSARNDIDAYSQSVASLIAPLLANGAELIAIVDEDVSHADVRHAVLTQLTAARGDTEIRVVGSKDFHDRFWIADRCRGVIMGTSLYKIGRKIFFMDALSNSDIAAILEEAETALAL
ncbi:hypothetical protein [Falsarthrobacter nasiphocae]|uniref:Uncharacterized protein n=1 Tax=Falsarthrobacter nasiphocae TaxID=189863 RepID=A0AAE4C5I5_9MICC|nr:hypothetical protein [Falsarthrobacter nasiphocae]MDR6891548.1 hypothetical protein [Falsarthrobacter nasiphocae]